MCGITGFIDLELHIDIKGRVTAYKVLKTSGHPAFKRETEKVIMQWRFPPPRAKGERVAVIYRYRVKFNLN